MSVGKPGWHKPLQRKAWVTHKNPTVERFNWKHTPLVNSENVLLPRLHIKLGLMKTFVKAMNHDGAAFMYLKEIFKQAVDVQVGALERRLVAT